MRLWSIHPQHLDPVGLVALWREALLAQAVLAGRTRGYARHPQLQRFREHGDPLAFIASYLSVLALEAEHRGYSFNRSKIELPATGICSEVTLGQLTFESRHLKRKLRNRNLSAYRRVSGLSVLSPHPCFKIIPGKIASWERV